MTRTTGVLGMRATRLMVLLGIACLAVLTAAAAPARNAFAAQDIQLFLGYADNDHHVPSMFPTPWANTPNVIFQGCAQSSCVLDSGAARLVNNTPVTVRVDSVVIRYDTCTYDIWPHGTTLRPGQQLIVTQTRSGTSHGCTPELGLMDSSDIGPGGSVWTGHCDQSGVIPEVDVTINGEQRTFRDTGQVLNTGGVDRAYCQADDNESTQWTLVGSSPCPGATLSLTPPTQTHRTGETATVQATLLNSCGTPLMGAPVHFEVLAGPNVGASGDHPTNAGGVATHTYTSSRTGTDTLQASVTNPAGTMRSRTVVVIWVNRTHMTGRAYAIASRGLVNIAPTPDTGPVDTTTATTSSPPCVLSITGTVSAQTLCASVVTSVTPRGSNAAASVQSVRIAAPLTPVIAFGLVQSSSQTTCAGSVGGVTIVSLTVNGVPVILHSPGPNTTMHLLGITFVLNEQLPVPGADHGLTVNAVHITIPGALDLVLSSATSDIHDC